MNAKNIPECVSEQVPWGHILTKSFQVYQADLCFGPGLVPRLGQLRGETASHDHCVSVLQAVPDRRVEVERRLGVLASHARRDAQSSPALVVLVVPTTDRHCPQPANGLGGVSDWDGHRLALDLGMDYPGLGGGHRSERSSSSHLPPVPCP